MDYATKQTIMATIIHNPSNAEGGSSLAVVMVGVIALFIAIGAFVLYGIPTAKSSAAPSQPNAIDMNIKLLEPETNGQVSPEPALAT